MGRTKGEHIHPAVRHDQWPQPSCSDVVHGKDDSDYGMLGDGAWPLIYMYRDPQAPENSVSSGNVEAGISLRQ